MAISGYLNIDKPLGMTSHDIVARVRRTWRTFGVDKVGHAGTLDPLATGVLVVCLGTATRLSEYVMDTIKQYSARVQLGIVTTTYDAEGEITTRQNASHIQLNDVEEVLPRFIGEIEQIPPMYSAIKQGGRKLYDLARAGQVVDRVPRRVRIDVLKAHDFSLETQTFTLDVTCSAGTYIRSLAYDLGEALGVGAHLSGLIRTASGSFTLEEAVSLDTILNSESPQSLILPADTPLQHWPSIHLDILDYEHVRHGRAIPSTAIDDSYTRAYTPDGDFIAILRSESGMWKPHKVFSL